MTKSVNFIKNKYKLVIFDFDGVIIDSKINMKNSWNDVRRKLNLNCKFESYFKHIGIPFREILIKNQIFDNHKKIEFIYKKSSLKNKNKIKIYNKAKIILEHLSKTKKISIVTSKDKYRTKSFLNHFKLRFDMVLSPSKKLKGKPSKDMLTHTLKKFRISKKDACYIGDTEYDYLASKAAGIDFIFARYGYGNYKKKYKYYINKFLDLRYI